VEKRPLALKFQTGKDALAKAPRRLLTKDGLAYNIDIIRQEAGTILKWA
jgi:hypothetical protein